MIKAETIIGQCENCGRDYELRAVLDGNQVILCPHCNQETNNYDTKEGSLFAPHIVTIVNDSINK